MLRLVESQSRRHSLLVSNAGPGEIIRYLAARQIRVERKSIRRFAGGLCGAHVTGDRHLLLVNTSQGIPRATYQDLAQVALEALAASWGKRLPFGGPLTFPTPSRATIQRELRHVAAREAL